MVLALLGAVALAFFAAPASGASAALVVERPTSGGVINEATPKFQGTSSDAVDPIKVRVYRGASTSGTLLQTLNASPELNGEWSTEAGSSLADGVYTVEAEQEEAGGLLGRLTSGPVTFEIDTKPPLVVLDQLTSPSKDTTPAFAGTASEPGTVTVEVFHGATAHGSKAGSLTASVVAGEWETATLSPALDGGEYTAVAKEPSAIGNGTGTSNEMSFEVEVEPPTVTLEPISSPTGDPTPSFSGSASESSTVTVSIYKGNKATGTAAATASASVSGEHWESSAVSPALSSGEYTAIATQPSSRGGGEGKSNTDTFKVDTSSPKVTLSAVKSPSADRTPEFTGTASADTQVVVDVYEGSATGGTPIATATAAGTEGAWTSDEASPSLSTGDHEYTAVAHQTSPVGNPEGVSEPVSFTVDTEAPTVTLEQLARSRNDAPTFSGTASEAGTVVVDVYEGPNLVAEASGTASGGTWKSGKATLPSGDHTYTAVATEQSALGNGEGSSNTMTFEVDTESPTVTIEQPPTPTDDTTPTFGGTASEDTKVVVHVFEGTKEVTSVSTVASGGKWSAGPATLPSKGDRTYTATAKEVSSLGNAEGTSSTVTFAVDTEAPTVTLAQPATPSKNTTPTFSGTASDTTPVTVHVLRGTSEVATVSGSVSGGSWTAGPLGTPLTEGQYTAYASEPSSVSGDAEGTSETVTFVVLTKPPTLTIQQPKTPSNDDTPSFAGTTSEAGTVVVHVYEGSSTSGPEVAKVSTNASGGTWSTGKATLPSGDRTFTAVAGETSAVGNGEGQSNQATFLVDTEAPKLELNPVSSPTGDTSQSFSGTTSEAGTVVVHVYEGSKPEGKEVGKVSTATSSGSFSTSAISLPGGDHTYTAVAREASGLENGEGVSNAQTFVLDTEAPSVTLASVPTPSRNTAPTFSGTASESTAVTVSVYEGSKAEGTAVSTVSTTASGGKWSAGPASLASGDHSYTAVAREVSGLGNDEGESTPIHFVVDTNPPALTLEQVKTPSNNYTPTFTGTTSEAGTVLVRVYEGPNEVASVSVASSAGQFTTPKVTLASEGDHTYTAVATEQSGLGNGEGSSNAMTFEVARNGPTVTLEQPATPSKNTTPTFSGTASEETKVVVHIYEGAKEITSVSTVASGGRYTTPKATLPGGEHTFTAEAIETSGLGNEPGTSAPVSFTVDTEAPSVTLASVPTPSRNTAPTFSGTASESTAVTVSVYEGSKAEGTAVSTVSTTASGGKWSAGPASLASGDHSYTAVAREVSGLGNDEGESTPIHFVVDTNPPTVTLNQPASPSKNTTPTLSGSASENTEVTVRVYEGSTEIANATTTASGGSWSAKVTVPGGDHTYTAVAHEVSGLGNAEGVSGGVQFVVNTEPPTVTINQTTTPSKSTSPTFTGTASEAGEVVVRVYEGSEAKGKEVGKVTATTAGGSWSASGITLTGGEHTYTAQATEASALGNGPGTSGPDTFNVNTEPPTVSLNQPSTPSRNTSPTLSGSASEDTEVLVRVYEGKVGGTEVGQARTTAAGGSWSATVSVPGGDHTYFAQATEASGLGNEAGKSNSVSFVVDTEPPTVTINQTTTPSSLTTPTFAGKAGENTAVVVHVYEGSRPEGTEVATASTTASGGSWSVKAVVPSGDHTYTAVAREVSGLGNAEGVSGADTFVVDTNPPTVTLNQPKTPSKVTTQSFSGTASENTKVLVRVYEGSTEVGSASTTASGGTFTTGTVTLSSGDHSYTAIAEETSGLGNEIGTSNRVSFVVDTEPPTVTIKQTTTPSKNTSPTFSGTASENTEVIVHVYEGTEAKGKEVGKVITTASGGSWSASGIVLSPSKGAATFTAQATEVSGLGNEAGTSGPDTFFVNVNPPTVTLRTPVTPSNVTTPTFTGTASEETSVTVHVYEGSRPEGTEVGKFTTTAKGGSWSVQGTVPGGDHTYTAVAKEVSGLGNAEGESGAVTFVIDTLAPVVELEPPLKVSNETKPAFSGTASETQPVTVMVYEGEKPEGKVAAKLTAVVSGGKWKTAHVNEALANGRYTAIASEESSFPGNPSGESEPRTFEVNTKAPRVTLTQPASPSNETSPDFSGETNEPTTVTVDVYEGEKPEGKIVATASATPSSGKWHTTSISAPLAGGDRKYTAVATEPSSLAGNPEGVSNAAVFTIDTEAPKVTLNQPKTPSNATSPTFGGTASESTEVIVRVYAGTEASGTEVGQAKTTASGGSWSASGITLASGVHTYTAQATELSGLHNSKGQSNPSGVSAPATFVVDTESPSVTLESPTSPISNRAPAFTGTASEEAPVTVEIYEKGGIAAKREPVSHAEAHGTEWRSGKASPALEFGREYEAVAVQESTLGNKPGTSAAVEFDVEAIPPIATTESAVAISPKQAELKGYVNPNGGEVTTCVLQYGTTTAYGSSAECAFTNTAITAFPSTGDTAIGVFARVFDLSPSTTYHFRVLAIDEGGTAVGGDVTFTTPAGRVVEIPKTPPSEGKTGTGNVLSFITQELVPPKVTIAALLKHGYYEYRFKSPLAGTAVIDWYYVPPGAKIGKKSKHPPVLVATGRLSFSSGKTGMIKIKLTTAGKRLLKHAKKIKLTQTCVFTPHGEAAAKAMGTFQLKR